MTDTDTAEVFRTRMKARRRELGMTQQQLGDAVGLDSSAVTRIEKGDRSVTISEAWTIAETLSTGVGELSGRDVGDYEGRYRHLLDRLVEIQGVIDRTKWI